MRLLCPCDLQARILEWVAISSSGSLPDPGMEPRSSVSPTFQVDSLLFVPSGEYPHIKKPALYGHFSVSAAWKGTIVEESAPDNIVTAPNSEGNEEEK